MLDWASYYANLGVALHALYPQSKVPQGSGWQNAPVATLPELATHLGQNSNLGARPGWWSQPYQDHSLLVIDLDIRKEDEAQQAIQTLESFLGVPMVSYPVVKSGSGGSSRHIWCSVPRELLPSSQSLVNSGRKYHDMVTNSDRWTWEIDLLSTGKNVVVPPSTHPDTGLRYEWVGRLPHQGVPLLTDHAIKQLRGAKLDSVYHEDQPEVLPEWEVTEVQDLVLSVDQKLFLIDGSPYNLTGDRGESILGIASILFGQGYDRQQVLSILVHNSPGWIVQEPPRNARFPERWLWKYAVLRVIDRESADAKLRYEKRNKLNGYANLPDELEVPPEFAIWFGQSNNSQTTVKQTRQQESVSAFEDLLQQARNCTPTEADKAVELYYVTKRDHSNTKAEIVLDALKEHGFTAPAIRADAKSKGKGLAREIREGNQPLIKPAVTYQHGQAWKDPTHPIHTGQGKGWSKLTGRYVYLPSSNKWYDMLHRTELNPDGMNLSTAKLVRELLIDEGFEPDEIPRNPKASEYLVNREDIVMVEGQTFFPGARGPIVEWNRKSYINRWREPEGWCEPGTTKDTWVVLDDDIRPWLDHLEYLYPHPDYRNLLVDWLSYTAQHPNEKINWQLVIGGSHRIGKDTLFEPMRSAVGNEYFGSVEFADVSSPYHGWLEDKKFVVVSESHQSDKRSWGELENRLKVLCAVPQYELLVNPKFGKQYTIPNLLSLVFTTNYRDGLLLQNTDRHLFLWTDAVRQEDWYYNNLYRWMDQLHGRERVGQWLRTRKINSHFDPKSPPPVTEWAREVLTYGMSETQLKIRTAVDSLIDQGRRFVTAEQIREWIRGSGSTETAPGVQRIRGVLSGFGMRALTDESGSPEILVPKALLSSGGWEELRIDDKVRTMVFPLTPVRVATNAELWKGLCPDVYKSQLERLVG